MVNHQAENHHAAAVAAALAGQPVRDVPPHKVGNGNTAGVHHPAYDFDDSVIPAGSSWYAGMVEARMPAA